MLRRSSFITPKSFSNTSLNFNLLDSDDEESISSLTKKENKNIHNKDDLTVQVDYNAYYLSKLDAKNVIESTQIKQERKVLIYYCCGAIAMKLNESDIGFSYEKNFLFSLMTNHVNFCDKEYTIKHLNPKLDPEGFLATPNNIFNKRIHYKILESNTIIDSSSMTLESWKKVGRVIRNNYEDYDSFIILHGSDTMTYTASMLSFMLENLSKPVILTGAQIPLSEMRNDATINLINALTIAGYYQIPEVCVLFGSNVYRGNRTIRNNNLDFDAFESPNFRPLAHLGVHINVNWNIILKEPTDNFTFFEDFNNNICTVKIFPMIDDETFAAFFEPPIEAVIIETYGVGNIPSNRPKLIETIKKANERGVIIMNVSQCKKGEVSSSYETGSILERLGVIFAGDITVECALAKLAYLLGKKYDRKTTQKLLKDSLRGELSVTQEEFFSFQSNSFINIIGKMMDIDKSDKNANLVFKSLVPSIIIEMIEQNDLEILKKFETEIRHIHFTEFSKKLPLHVAAKNSNEKIVEFLLKFKNLKINLMDYKKMTPLNYACLYKNSKVANLLFERGGILSNDSQLRLGNLFCKLAFDGELENLKLFHKCGANIMTPDNELRTCAHIAAAEGRIEIVKFLLDEITYNLNVKDKVGRTPIKESSNKEILNMLKLKYGTVVQRLRLKKSD